MSRDIITLLLNFFKKQHTPGTFGTGDKKEAHRWAS